MRSDIAVRYEEFIGRVTERKEEVERLEEFLRAETSWLTSPASTRFHMNYEGGLVEHSINVVETLLKLRDAIYPEASEESCVIVGLYHDLGKIGEPGKPYYLPNPSDWHVKKMGANYIINPQVTYMDIATRSVLIASKYISLTFEEAQAIRYHDGQYIPENKGVSHREKPLTRLVHYADNWSGGVLEE